MSDEPLTPTQINLVQATWAKVVPIAGPASDMFYDKLFELDPSLRPLFPDDMAEQKKKLMRMIGVAVASLRNLDTLVPGVQELGRRHATYGVEDEHYNTVGVALLWTLEEGLGDAFTDDVKEAWADTYGLLATTMKDAAATSAST